MGSFPLKSDRGPLLWPLFFRQFFCHHWFCDKGAPVCLVLLNCTVRCWKRINMLSLWKVFFEMASWIVEITGMLLTSFKAVLQHGVQRNTCMNVMGQDNIKQFNTCKHFEYYRSRNFRISHWFIVITKIESQHIEQYNKAALHSYKFWNIQRTADALNIIRHCT